MAKRGRYDPRGLVWLVNHNLLMRRVGQRRWAMAVEAVRRRRVIGGLPDETWAAKYGVPNEEGWL